jgi:hypothetical protein
MLSASEASTDEALSFKRGVFDERWHKFDLVARLCGEDPLIHAAKYHQAGKRPRPQGEIKKAPPRSNYPCLFPISPSLRTMRAKEPGRLSESQKM